MFVSHGTRRSRDWFRVAGLIASGGKLQVEGGEAY